MKIKQPLHSSGGLLYTKYMKENRNLDICVSGQQKKQWAIRQGSFILPTLPPPPPLLKRGHLTQSLSQQTANIRSYQQNKTTNRIHILEQNGQLFRNIDNCHLHHFYLLWKDTRDNLFVAEYFTNKVKKGHYCVQINCLHVYILSMNMFH